MIIYQPESDTKVYFKIQLDEIQNNLVHFSPCELTPRPYLTFIWVHSFSATCADTKSSVLVLFCSAKMEGMCFLKTEMTPGGATRSKLNFYLANVAGGTTC